MSTVMFKGEPIQTNGSLPKIGSIAPEFTLVRHDLTEIKLSQLPGQYKILNIVPSLDTAVCARSFKEFHALLEQYRHIALYTVSKDLPFAQGRVCASANLPNSEVLSAFRSPFAQEYGLEITNGPLKGLCSRAVIVLDEKNIVLYNEQVKEITQEPNYQLALAALGEPIHMND